jgi:hypothetical protein
MVRSPSTVLQAEGGEGGRRRRNQVRTARGPGPHSVYSTAVQQLVLLNTNPWPCENNRAVHSESRSTLPVGPISPALMSHPQTPAL